MARTVAAIKAQILEQKAAEVELAGLTSDSQSAIFNAWAFGVAVCIAFFEQILDIFRTEVETIARKSVAATCVWIRERVLEFQYDATIAQIATIIDAEVAYPTVDETKRIISRCSVKTSGVAKVDIKVATGDTPAPLSAPQLLSLDGYINTFEIAGITINLINKDADKLYVAAEILYDGQYSSTIEDAVIAALDDYCVNLSSEENFDGVVKVTDIEDAIQAVLGVKDVKITAIKARQDLTVFGSATPVYDLSAGINIREWLTQAGYIIQETTGGQTFADSLTFTAN